MADSRFLMRALRVALIPAGLLVAMAATLNAASEVGVALPGSESIPVTTLTAEVQGLEVGREFRIAAGTDEARNNGGFPRISAALARRAREVYAVDPLQVPVLRTIALGEVLYFDPDRARNILRLAQDISKRDDVTELWLAQDYGKKGDLDSMMAAFDVIMRTHPQVRDVAMTPVVEALAAPGSAKPLGKLIALRPEWEKEFWHTLASNPVGVDNAANFLASNDISIERLPTDDRKILYANLRRGSQFDSLAKIAALDPDSEAGAQELTAGAFVTAEQGYPFGWNLRASGDASAQVHRGSGELQIDARYGTSGIAADRIAPLSGQYRLKLGMAEPIPTNAKLKLAATCAEGAQRELATMNLGAGRNGGEITLQADDCRYVRLVLSFEVEPGRRDALIRISSIAAKPL